MRDFKSIVEQQFPSKKVVVVGDLVADQFLRGTIARVSREAPVFILRHDETETLAGGAANAAVNVASLGATALLVGVTGDDANGRALLSRLADAGVDCGFVTESPGRGTTTKVRVLAGQHYAPRQQVIRIDYENDAPLSADVKSRLLSNLSMAAEDADAIILSDYNYGAADAEIGAAANAIARTKGIPLLVDSRFRLSEFAGATTATPNQDEVEQILGAEFTIDDCAALCKRLGFESLLVTRGNKGMVLLQNDRPALEIAAVGATEPIDVTGAGDTVIAAFALGLASGLGFDESANLANHAGGIVVMKKGTAAVTPAELVAALREHGIFGNTAVQ